MNYFGHRMNSPLVVIVGPTASGKSDLAMQIAQQFNGEIICADSRTVYKNMDIGTAKPTIADRTKVVHHLLDVVTPLETFSAARFKELALRAIKEVSTKGKLPILVGGTGLYVDSVLYDYEFGPQADLAQRNKFELLSVDELKKKCLAKGLTLPLNENNKRHLIRALELGGHAPLKKDVRKATIVVGITTNRDELRERISDRVNKMFTDGVLSEAAHLGQKYGWDNEAMKGGIYHLLHELLQGKLSQEQVKEQSVKSDMYLAKRQLTWFKRNSDIKWGEPEELYQLIAQFVRSYQQGVSL